MPCQQFPKNQPPANFAGGPFDTLDDCKKQIGKDGGCPCCSPPNVSDDSGDCGAGRICCDGKCVVEACPLYAGDTVCVSGLDFLNGPVILNRSGPAVYSSPPGGVYVTATNLRSAGVGCGWSVFAELQGGLGGPWHVFGTPSGGPYSQIEQAVTKEICLPVSVTGSHIRLGPETTTNEDGEEFPTWNDLGEISVTITSGACNTP